MRRLAEWYGASPWHLLALLAGFAVSAYAVTRVPSLDVLVTIGLWFAGLLVLHDLVLFPIYAGLDNVGSFVRWAFNRTPRVPWVNHVRFPTVWSALLLLAWFPLVLRVSPGFRSASGRSDHPFLWHWLLVAAVLYIGSAALFAVRVRLARGKTHSP